MSDTDRDSLSRLRIGDLMRIATVVPGTNLRPGDVVHITAVISGSAERYYLGDHGAPGVSTDDHGHDLVMATAPGVSWHWYLRPDQILPAGCRPVSPIDRPAFRRALVAVWGQPAQTGRPTADQLLDGLFDRVDTTERERDRLRRSLQDVRHHLDRAHRNDVVGWQRLALELSDAITAAIGTGAAETEADRG